MPTPNPGAIANVAAGNAIDPDWGNAIRDRVVNDFANATNRDAAITSPVEGQLAYTTDTHTLWVYDGVTWRPGSWNMQWGLIAKATTTVAQAGLSAVTDLTSLTVTFTAVANRQYQITAIVGVTKHTGGDAILILSDGAGVEKARGRITMVDAALAQVSLNLFETYTAGSVTRKLRLQASAGTVDSNVTNSTQIPFVLVEDIGPATTTPT